MKEKTLWTAVLMAVCPLLLSAAGPTAEDIYNRIGTPEEWTPPNGERLWDENFIVPGGSVHFIGKIDGYSSESGNPVILCYAKNEVNGQSANVCAQLDSAGNFVVDIPVEHAQTIMLKLGDFYGSAFVFPGDTIHYRAADNEIVDFDSNNPETLDINALKYVLGDSLNDLTVNFMSYYNVPQQGYDGVMAFNEKVKGLTREAVARLTKLLTPLNISQRSKDILFTDLLIEVYFPIEEVLLHYGGNRFIRSVGEDGKTQLEQNPDFKEIDPKVYFDGQEDFMAYLWDNPYVVCTGGTYINRVEFGVCKWQVKNIASDVALNVVSPDYKNVLNIEGSHPQYTSRYSRLAELSNEQESDYGIGNDFMSQLIVVKTLLGVVNNSELSREALKKVTTLGSDVMRMVNYKDLVETYNSALNDFAMKVAIKEGGAAADESSLRLESKSEVLAKIVAPYKGRVVYVDVWDSGCGPCRAGMISQKELLEKFKDEPLTVIYLAPESSREACEKFLQENGIKGEHVFLSNDDDARFKADFDIQGIPFGILIKKNGEFTTNFSSNLLDYVFEQALAE